MSRFYTICLVISNVRRGNKVEHKIYFALVSVYYIYLLQMDRLLTFQPDFKNQSCAIDYVCKRHVCYCISCLKSHALLMTFKNNVHPNFYFLLTVHLSIFISVINQIDAQNFCFTISLFHASTCFEHMCSSSGGQNCITQPLVPSHL